MPLRRGTHAQAHKAYVRHAQFTRAHKISARGFSRAQHSLTAHVRANSAAQHGRHGRHARTCT
eukprot:3795242-Pleurochrysis_carterae.AAC.1